MGPGDPSVLGWDPTWGLVLSGMGDPTWGSPPIWGGVPDLGVALLVVVGVGVGGRGVGDPILGLPYIYLRARVLEVWLRIWGP